MGESTLVMTASARTGSTKRVAKWVTSLACAGARAYLPPIARKVETSWALVKQAVKTT